MTPRRSLEATTVWVTRPRQANSVLSRRLRGAGARVVWQPAIEVRNLDDGALDAPLRRLHGFDWLVFTSARGVASFTERLRALHIDVVRARHLRIAVVGPATAAAVRRAGLEVAVMGEPYSAVGLVSAMAPLLDGRPSMLYPRPLTSGSALVESLRALGATVEDVPVYRTVPAAAPVQPPDRLTAGDCVVFCSPSAIAAVSPLRHRLDGCAVACIGPTTAAAARDAGWPVAIVPGQATAAALADAVIGYYREVAR